MPPISDPKTRKDRRIELESNGGVSLEELRAIVKRDESKCIYCGIRVECYCTTALGDARGFDHLLPLSNGGEHSAWNLAVCCMRCNTHKGVTPFPEFIKQRDLPLRWFEHLDPKIKKILKSKKQEWFDFKNQ